MDPEKHQCSMGDILRSSYMSPQSVKELKVKPKTTLRGEAMFVGFCLPFTLEIDVTLSVFSFPCQVLTKEVRLPK